MLIQILENRLFYLLSILCLLSAIMVITSQNPVNSVFFLILAFLNASGLLILLEVEFLAMIFLVVYVGAIAVLFLFVVMMLNVRLVELQENILRYLPIGGLIGIIFLLEIFLIIKSDFIFIMHQSTVQPLLLTWVTKIDNGTHLATLGQLIYTKYFLLFLIASLILLVAMIGAIVLTLEKKVKKNKKDVFDQISRDFLSTIKVKDIYKRKLEN